MKMFELTEENADLRTQLAEAHILLLCGLLTGSNQRIST